MNINIEIIEKYIRQEQEHIHKLDEKGLPDVLDELRLEQKHSDSYYKGVDPRDITEISIYVIEHVFTCWSMMNAYDEWIEKMKEEQAALNLLNGRG